MPIVFCTNTHLHRQRVGLCTKLNIYHSSTYICACFKKEIEWFETANMEEWSFSFWISEIYIDCLRRCGHLDVESILCTIQYQSHIQEKVAKISQLYCWCIHPSEVGEECHLLFNLISECYVTFMGRTISRNYIGIVEFRMIHNEFEKTQQVLRLGFWRILADERELLPNKVEHSVFRACSCIGNMFGPGQGVECWRE